MKSRIELNRMQVYAHHGVLPQETCVGNLFEVTVHISYDFELAARGCDLSRTINYAEVAGIVEEVMATPQLLLETVAFALRDALLERWPGIGGGMVKVCKLHPPFTAKVESAAVVLEW